jgi:hypothetical protein
MESIFENETRNELISRIHTLNENSVPRWGKMNIFQMVKHCTNWDKWIQGREKYVYKQAFIGILFGKIALKRMVMTEKPFDKNVPTSTQFKVKEKEGDLIAEKQNWISLIESYEQYTNPDFVHDFFGKMTKEQIGIMAYKHTDHHLRQFKA